MKKRKIVALLASCFLILSLSACGNSTNNVEPTPSDATQPPETIEPSTESTTEPTAEPSEEPTTTPSQETTTAPAEEPGEQVPTNEETTQEPTTPTVTAPVHTHSYSNSVTQEATCDTNGIRTYVCSCGNSYTENIQATGHTYDGGQVVKEATCMEVGGKVFTCTKCGTVYTEAIPVNSNHTWGTRHVDAYGYYEKGKTHEVMIKKCAGCGYQVNSDQPNANEIWERHLIDCGSSYSYWTEQVPNGEPKWIEVTPAHDETYCTSCGMIQ